MNRKQISIIAAALLAYALGYFMLRSQKFIVHSVVRSHHFTYLEHSIRDGDMGMAGGLVSTFAAKFYTPLRLVECGYWYLCHPVGTPLSEADRSRLPY